LAQLGVARAYYALGRYAASSAAYDAVPRFSRYWDQALFENGYARFRAGDLGGALGSLKSLHAPQFEGAFLPESWILTATIYFYSCLYEESKVSLGAFEQVYAPMIEKLKPVATGQKELTDYYRLLGEDQFAPLPRPVSVWIRSNDRLRGLLRVLDETRHEQRVVSGLPQARSSKAGQELLAALDDTERALTQVAGQLVRNRLEEAYHNIKDFSDQAELLRFETTKAEKELVEAGVDQGALLAHQRLYRPKLPAPHWEYWKFDGEFWMDEVGYYQYTLKNGCPAAR
jgi:hypothetical protein